MMVRVLTETCRVFIKWFRTQHGHFKV